MAIFLYKLSGFFKVPPPFLIKEEHTGLWCSSAQMLLCINVTYCRCRIWMASMIMFKPANKSVSLMVRGDIGFKTQSLLVCQGRVFALVNTAGKLRQ